MCYINIDISFKEMFLLLLIILLMNTLNQFILSTNSHFVKKCNFIYEQIEDWVVYMKMISYFCISLVSWLLTFKSWSIIQNTYMNHFKDNFFKFKSFLGPFRGKHHNSSLQICLCIRQRKTNIIHYLNLYNSDKKGLF